MADARGEASATAVAGEAPVAAVAVAARAVTNMYVDAQNVLTITSNFISSKQTRHIARRELIVREREIEGHLKMEKVASADNLADLLTKALDRVPFEKLKKLIMNILATGVWFLSPRGKRAPRGVT